MHPLSENHRFATSGYMEHLTIYFTHDIRDILPYSDFIAKVRPVIETEGIGEYLGDDMAIDGGDATGIFVCHSARVLFDTIGPELRKLPFMKGAKITFIFGALDSDARREEFYI